MFRDLDMAELDRAQLEMYRSVFEKSGGEPGRTASDQNLIPAGALHLAP
jgi:hypothetical protein